MRGVLVIKSPVAITLKPFEGEAHENVQLDVFDPHRTKLDARRRPIAMTESETLLFERTPVAVYVDTYKLLDRRACMGVFSFTNIDVLAQISEKWRKEYGAQFGQFTPEQKANLVCTFKGPAAATLNLADQNNKPSAKELAVVTGGMTDMRNTSKFTLHFGNLCVVRARVYGDGDDPVVQFTDYKKLEQRTLIIEVLGAHHPEQEPYQPAFKHKGNQPFHTMAQINASFVGNVCAPGVVGPFNIWY